MVKFIYTLASRKDKDLIVRAYSSALHHIEGQALSFVESIEFLWQRPSTITLIISVNRVLTEDELWSIDELTGYIYGDFTDFDFIEYKVVMSVSVITEIASHLFD